jgi:hypothetical protein
MIKNNKNWTPPSSIEEKIQEFLIPGKLYFKHLKKGRLHDISLFINQKDHRYAPISKENFIYNFIFFPHN